MKYKMQKLWIITRMERLNLHFKTRNDKLKTVYPSISYKNLHKTDQDFERNQYPCDKITKEVILKLLHPIRSNRQMIRSKGQGLSNSTNSLNAKKQMETNERSWKRYPPIPSIGSGSIRSIAQLDSRADRSIDLSEEVGEIWRRSHVTSDGWLIGKEFQHGNRAWNVIFRGICMWIRFKFSLDRCDKRAVKHNGSGWLSIGKIPIQDFPRNSIRWEGIFLFFLCVDSNGFLGG